MRRSGRRDAGERYAEIRQERCRGRALCGDPAGEMQRRALYGEPAGEMQRRALCGDPVHGVNEMSSIVHILH